MIISISCRSLTEYGHRNQDLRGKIHLPLKKYGISRFVPGKTLLSGKFMALFSKAAYLTLCKNSTVIILEPYWPTSTGNV